MQSLGAGENVVLVVLTILALLGLSRGAWKVRDCFLANRPIYGSLAWTLTMASLLMAFVGALIAGIIPESPNLGEAMIIAANVPFWLGVVIGASGFLTERLRVRRQRRS